MSPLLEITAARPMLYAGFYPFNPSEHRGLKQALEKLCINDASVSVKYVKAGTYRGGRGLASLLGKNIKFGRGEGDIKDFGKSRTNQVVVVLVVVIKLVFVQC